MNPENMTPEELVILLATEGMGWRLDESTDWWYAGDVAVIELGMWNPLTDANDRNGLVEKMVEKGWSLIMNFWRVKDGDKFKPQLTCKWKLLVCEDGFVATTDTPGDAVCLAAAKALQAIIRENSHKSNLPIDKEGG